MFARKFGLGNGSNFAFHHFQESVFGDSGKPIFIMTGIKTAMLLNGSFKNYVEAEQPKLCGVGQ